MSDPTSRVPELHFDLLARVIPGALTLAFYLGHRSDLLSSVGNVALGMIAAYAVGFTIHLIALPLFCYLLFDRLCRRFYRPSNGWPVDSGRMWRHRAELTGEQKDLFLKRLGERNMFLCLMFVSLVSIVIPPPIAQSLPQYVLPISSLAFLNGFYWSSEFITREIEAYSNQKS